jgi:hypothetical protein
MIPSFHACPPARPASTPADTHNKKTTDASCTPDPSLTPYDEPNTPSDAEPHPLIYPSAKTLGHNCLDA